MSQHLGTYPPHDPVGAWSISKPSGWIVSRTNDYEAGKVFAELNGYRIYRSLV